MRATRGLVSILVFGILLAPVSTGAQQPGKVHRVGILNPSFSGFAGGQASTSLPWLAELGYVERQNITFESRSAAGKDERLPELAAELVRLKVDVIVTWGTAGTRAAKQATTTIPIVMVSDVDPVKAGLVASLARPGGNVTGVSILTADLSGKRLQLLREAVRALARVGVLWNPANPEKAEEWRQTREAAGALGLQLLPLEVPSPSDLEPAFKAAKRERAGALLVLGDRLTFGRAKEITDLATRNRLPAVYPSRWFIDVFSHGGLMSYGPSDLDVHRSVTAYVNKILKGTKPADLPVEQPTQFELVVNLKAAKAIGLTIPKSVVVRADKVIE